MNPEAASRPARTPPQGPGAAARATRPMPPAGTSVLELHALLLRHPRFDTAAHAVLAELQRRLRCERVSLGWCRGRGGKVRLAALSSGEAAERRSFTRALQAAMREAVEEAATVIYPLPPGAASGPLPAHEALVREAGGVTIASVPIVGAQRLLGVLLLERREGFDAAALQAAQDAALFIGPVLDLMKRLDAPVSGRWLQPRTPMLAAGAEAGNAAAWSAGTTRRRITTGRVAAVVLPLALAVCGALPAPHEVVAPARLEGGRQRIVSSPIDGYVSKVTVRPGAEVKAGELLVQLDDRDPELARQRWLAEVSQHDKQYREALTQDDPAAIAMARARLQQAQVQLAQAERELEHTRVLAPMAGLVLGGDLTQAVGMPVQRGQTLLTVAPVHDLKVVAEVDEQDVVWLAPGQTARVLFASAASAPLPFTLARVSPVALAVDNRNIFEVEGQLSAAAAPAEAAAALRPGQRGVVRITLAERPRAELWWMAAADLWRRWWWRWVG